MTAPGSLPHDRRHMLATLALPHPASPLGEWVTFTGGITTCIPDASTTTEGMVTRADDVSYAAKSLGRDRFFSFEMQLDTVEQLKR